MNAITHRSTAVLGSLVFLAVAALTGCASTGGTASGSATSHALATQAVPTTNLVCSGGHASRFPQREELGRVCTPSPLRHAIY
jgi:hypothetical protein